MMTPTAETAPKSRRPERIFLLLITLILGIMFWQFYAGMQARMRDVPQRLASGSMVNLSAEQPARRLAALLEQGFYLEDPKDIRLVRDVVQHAINDGRELPDNIGELNKSRFAVQADEAWNRGGSLFQERVLYSRSLLGFSGPDSLRYAQEQHNPPALSSEPDAGLGQGRIRVRLRDKEGNELPGVLVRLQMLLPSDSLLSGQPELAVAEKNQPALRSSFTTDEAGNRRLESLTAYARTDAEGTVVFKGLPEERAYELIPLQPGFEFGAPAGLESLDGSASFRFRQRPHTIRLFSNRVFEQLKKEQSLIVREPAEARMWVGIIAAVFLLAFWLLHLLLSRRLPTADQLVVPVLMLLTGLSLLSLLSLQDPLRDRFLGRSTLAYFVLGYVALLAILMFDLRRLTPDSGLYRLFAFRNRRDAASGWPWALLASGLLMLTILFGSGPEGSGVRVNLWGFQPSEWVKFILIFFLAGFFTANERFISEYASWRKRWSFFSFALFAILLTMMLFLVLGDLGPAMVVCFTFIVLFSFSRGDFMELAALVILYALLCWLVKPIWLATLIAAVVLALYMGLKRRLSESPVMALAVMSAFMLLDQIPGLDRLLGGPVQRLSERKAIWLNSWNNEVFGGDHVANSIWAIATGGWGGHGIGQGFAKTIPEAHTDMILPAISEELGLAALLGICILMLIYLHRAIIIGRRAGAPFLFYICAGIGIATFVQFVLIAGGSTGALPLSGVSLPFISYGGSSLIANMMAAGLLLSVSVVRGTPAQLQYLARRQDQNLVPALLASVAGLVLLAANAAQYVVNQKKWLVQPALVAERSGARIFSYNPRIYILMNRLQAGDLLDRRGRLLASSNAEHLSRQHDSLVRSGLDPATLHIMARRRQDRYYPFGAHMFFWTGDANTGLFSGGTNGYFAEYEHAAELRGFHTPSVSYEVQASRYREQRFLPQRVREMTLSRRDYSALLPMLLAGPNSALVDSFKKQNRDLRLSMDAALQTALNQSLQSDESLRGKRVSVVVLNDSTGDVLASAMYPLPALDNWEQMNLSIAEQNRLSGWVTNADPGFTHATQPGSTVKILTALAGLNKLGLQAASQTYLVRPGDLIRASGPEPDETGTIGMGRAIIKSNNVYFVRLANEQRLEEEMVGLYMKTGMFLHGAGGYYYAPGTITEALRNRWMNLWRRTEFRSLQHYDRNNIRATRGLGISGMAWGQGELIATPASVARMAAGIAHKGVLVPNRYVLQISDSLLPVAEGVPLARDPRYAAMLTQWMKQQSQGRISQLGIQVAGKTGTPERILRGKRINDGWYVFFAPQPGTRSHTVVCVRIEQSKGSGEAVQLAGRHVIPELQKRGYMTGFAPAVAQ